jgi:hypothetical protein
MKDMQGYIVNNNCTTIIIIINNNITNELWFLYYPWLLLTLIGMCTKKIIMKPHNSRWHVRENGKLQRFLGHFRKVSWGRCCLHSMKKNKGAHMTERLLERDEWLLHFFIFIIVFWWIIDLDWHVHQKDNHETAQLSMTCQRGWKPAQFFRTC